MVSIAGAAPIGKLAAEALRRPHTSAATLSAVTATAGDTSLLVVADAADCTLAGLFPLLRARAQGGVRVGLLTGRDHAAQVFGLAKILAAPTGTARSADLLLHGPTGCARTLPDDTPIPLSEAIEQGARHLLIDAHGSAAHAHLDPYLVCGLTGDTERTIDGRPIPGGCTRTRCKIARDAPLKLLRPHELRASVLGLFVCNAITLAPAEQYPSDVALALDACEGYPSAVIGLLRGDAATGSAEPAHAARLLRAHLPLGDIALHVNQLVARRGTDPSILLLGDPDQGMSGSNSPTANTGQHNARNCMTRTSATLPPSPAPLLETSATWERALRSMCEQRPDRELKACLDEMQRARAAARQLSSASASASRDEQAWARAALDILHRTRSGSFGRLFTALSAPLLPQPPQPASACPYCACPRTEISKNGHFALTCPRCGPSAVGSSRLSLTLKSPSHFVPGQAITVHVTVTATTSHPVLVALQLRNRSTTRGSYAATTMKVTPGHTAGQVLQPPVDVEPELHRVWAVAAHHFDLALAQNRIPALPAVDMLA
ncbi:hypothetical protein AB0I81_60930 [Nonomuraea sp. NPDC050404]|uniref:hypothetical protein n=1 Tax=Nonomuraea sp. NPDC050404 TaxID=3155783 RepID=UPI0033C25FF7